MPHLNYHHLRYFWVIASEGSLTRAAERLNVSPSSLSIQLKALEDQVGQQLFERRGKSLFITEAGRIALSYADTVFRTGHELMEALSGVQPGRHLLRIGAAATLSRNFQIQLLRPLAGREGIELVLRSGNVADLLGQLDAHKLDVVLANHPAPPDGDAEFDSTLLAEQPVSLVARPPKPKRRFRFPHDLAATPVVLPGRGSAVRSAFDAALGRAGIRPDVRAEVDDMAMLRLMARDCDGVTLVPPIVVVDELNSGILVERHRLEGIREQFYAITQHRRFPNPLVSELLKRPSPPRQTR